MRDIGGIVLAAGLSDRMRGPLPKQLLPLGGLTLAAVTVRRAESSVLDRIVVVTGHRSGDVARAVGGGRAEIVDNPDYRDGNMTSFRVGAKALEGCAAFVVLLADMPGVTAEMINRIVDEWQLAQPWAAVSSYTDGRAHPLLLSAAAMNDAVLAEGAKGVWRFLDGAPEGWVEQIVFNAPMPADINTKAEYEGMLADGDED